MASLYQKYRPTNFALMIGQRHITDTLSNQLASGVLSHAYLFVGSRGTGKTSAAKIFARGINCTSPKSAPCGKCEVCKSLEASTNIDILEIDAASNNGVDEIRELRNNINFMPVHGKYKVYIIDEVHMLTIGAFNALLKTLEEPPKHVVFILATTEPHRLPSTILSRCMRFDFRLVDTAELSQYLGSICKKEKLQPDKESLDYIAMRAEGSVRDALSLLDTVAAYSPKISIDAIQDILGTLDKNYLFGILQSIYEGDIAAILAAIDSVIRVGKSMVMLARDIVLLARDMLVCRTVSNPQSVIVGTVDAISKLALESAKYTGEFLISVVSSFAKLEPELRLSLYPRTIFEIAAIMCAKSANIDINSISQRVDRLEGAMSNGDYNLTNAVINNRENVQDSGTNIASENIIANNVVIDNVASANIASSIAAQGVREAVSLDVDTIKGKLITYMREQGRRIIWDLLSSHNNYSLSKNSFVIQCDEDKYAQFDTKDVRDSIVQGLAGISSNLSLSIDKVKPINIDKEVDKIRKLVGGVPLVVK